MDRERMKSGLGWKKEVGAFTAMATVEITNVGINTLYKAASLKGLSYFVFIAYTYVLGTFLLIPLPFIFPKRGLPPFQLSVLYKIVLSSLSGILSNVCMFKGLEYSSPALYSIIDNLVPAFTFILAIIFRMENPDLRTKTTQLKIIGTVLSITGAMVAILYEGPTILSPASSSPPASMQSASHSLETSSQTNWVIGGFLLVFGSVFASLWYIIQVMKVYPDERSVAALYFLCKTLIAVPICIVADPKWSQWTLRPNIALITIILSGLFGSSFFSFIATWVMHLKGPLYASIFTPFSITIATAFGVIFLGDALVLGSVVGAAIILLGFYGVLWGKAQEGDGVSDSPHEKTPLLQN